MPLPLISVYLPTRNRLALLSRAIDSVLAQDYPAIELLVIDDASDDGTWAYLQQRSAADPRLRIWRNESVAGACTGRNRAIAEARGEFLTGLDDDDYLLPQHLSALHACWRRLAAGEKQLVAVFPARVSLQPDGSLIPLLYHSPVGAADLLRHNYIGNQLFAPVQTFRTSGGFDPAMPAWQDYELWYRMLGRDGMAWCSEQQTYVVDMAHDYGRISGKPADQLLQAYSRFITRHLSGRPLADKLRVRLLYLRYPQVDFKLAEVFWYWHQGLFLRACRLYWLKRLQIYCPQALRYLLRVKNTVLPRGRGRQDEVG